MYNQDINKFIIIWHSNIKVSSFKFLFDISPYVSGKITGMLLSWLISWVTKAKEEKTALNSVYFAHGEGEFIFIIKCLPVIKVLI